MKAMNRIAVCGMAAACIVSTSLHAATPGAVETWETGAAEGWVRYDPLNMRNETLASTSRYLSVDFALQTFPAPQISIVRADMLASGGNFASNYWNSAITNIGFRFYCQSMPPGMLEVYMVRQDVTNWWSRPLDLPASTGWTEYAVSVGCDEVWRSGDKTGYSADFKADMKSVTWVGISIRRNSSTSAQVFGIDDFSINGASMTLDADDDGMTDWAEFMAGTDPGDMSSRFEALMGRTNVASGVAVKWKSAPGRVYGLPRATNMNDAFSKVASGIDATPPENVFVDTNAVGHGPYFYKIELED